MYNFLTDTRQCVRSSEARSLSLEIDGPQGAKIGPLQWVICDLSQKKFYWAECANYEMLYKRIKKKTNNSKINITKICSQGVTFSPLPKTKNLGVIIDGQFLNIQNSKFYVLTLSRHLGMNPMGLKLFYEIDKISIFNQTGYDPKDSPKNHMYHWRDLNLNYKQ